jgi:hypothetical protein
MLTLVFFGQALRSMDLSDTAVDDALIPSLAALPHLTALRLNDQPPMADISDAGILQMTKLRALRTLELRGNSAVTPTGEQLDPEPLNAICSC